MRTQDTDLGFLAHPDADGPFPGVVIVHDVWGLYDHYRDLARRLADAGFAALAVDFYRRIGGKPPIASPAEALDWIAQLDDRQLVADAQEGIDALAAGPSAGARVGITGFCMGGTYALLAACGCAGLSACVSFYGMVRYPDDRDRARKPRSPLEALPELTCPVLGLYGEEDHLIPVADAEALRAGLARSPHPGEVVLYPGAGHAFVNDTREATYRPEAARDAWDRMLAFFRAQLA